MSGPWKEFSSELGRWKRSGREVEFWWRDDDAGPPTAPLGRLLRLAESSQVPLTLAMIPGEADASAFSAPNADLAVIQHGVDHRNRSGPQEKKNEFPESEPVDEALRRLTEGRMRLSKIAGNLFVPVLAPPWNRISQALTPRLEFAGFCGLSRFGVRNITNASSGLIEANTHVDVIDWRGTRGFCGAERALTQATNHLEARRTGRADKTEPTGWLTHHAVHDEPCWTFLEQLFDATRSVEGVRWLSAAAVFAR